MGLYFVAIEPNAELSNKVRSIQKDFKDRFGAEKAYKNFPHITIIPPFMHDEKNESEIVRHFQKTVLDTYVFEIVLNGFKSFPNKKHPVIFIQPEINEKLKSVHKSFDKNMNIFNYVKNFNPHLTVAYRDLSFESYEKAWKEYENIPFFDVFLVEKVGLYKHFDAKWNLISTKELKNTIENIESSLL